ncbi:MAG: flagellar biosynthesis protein FlgG [Alphaproteobacteria bacterium]
MMTQGIGLFELTDTRLDYLETRHTLIAQNVANGNTPDFQAKDLVAFEKAMDGARHVPVTRTHGAHLIQDGETDPFRTDQRPTIWETVPSGNSVNLEQEMIKASEVAGAHSLVSNIYAKHMSMLRMGFSSTS